MKRHARAADGGRLLWVGDEQDWRFMRSHPRPTLHCPQASCGDRLHAVCNALGTRFLRRSSGGACGHWSVSGSSATGPESQRHLWLKARLASICLHLGWAAVPEDPVTRADVWVPDAALALEVQLRRTDILARTAARFQAGAAGVVWLLADDVPANRTLFAAPSVRCAVIAPGHGAAVRPWETPCPDARLVVYGTVWRWQEWRLATGAVSAYGFLAELLAGRLGWCPPGTPGFPPGRGGWVRWSDLAQALALPADAAPRLPALLPVSPDAWIEAQLGQRKAPGARAGARE
jgi:hypothetical protein